ncbi:MAG TPA: SDR family oxidoreductase [Bryobacteraceae bacterium]|nr:SDR family oxidoreductase [Bryobacteraceae bacterium]
MNVGGKTVIVTGAGHGIGRALALRLAREGARVAVADVDEPAVRSVAHAAGGAAFQTDVTSEPAIRELVNSVIRHYGPIDLFCSNAGIFVEGGVDTPDSTWEHVLSVNFRAHLYAARAVLPQMLGRGEGYLLQVVSAAGSLTQIGSASYAVTKHAALALAEWISVEYGDAGIKVSCVCPQGVTTRMLLGDSGDKESFLKQGAISAGEVADAVIAGLADERFLILPHPEVATYFQRKASDYDRWLRGMRRLKARPQSPGLD